MWIFLTGNNNLKGPARTLGASLKGAFISPGFTTNGLLSVWHGLLTCFLFDMDLSVLPIFFVSLFLSRTMLGKKRSGSGREGLSLDAIHVASAQLASPPPCEEDWALGQIVRHWTFTFQPVCLREVAAHPWLVDLGSGLEMLPFERLFTVFL